MMGLLRLASTVASVIVIVSFAAFAADQAGAGSKHQVKAIDNDVNAPAPSTATERARERDHGRVRETIDDANDVLVRPFTGVTSSNDIWVARAVPALVALLVYGLLVRLLLAYASSAPSRARRRLGGSAT